MLIEKDDLLSDWIKRNISPDCDAEPTAFAKYVLALLKKDSDEAKLRGICEDQLSVFLGSHTKEFVDSLFVALADRSYLNGSSQRSSSPAAADRSDDGDAGASNNGRSLRRRISPPARDEKDTSKERDDRRRRSRSPRRRFTGRDRHQRSRTRSRSPHRRDERREYRRDRDRGDRAATAPAQRGRRRCRDFEEKGLCRRGDNCQYDHGPDPIILDDGNMDNFQPEFSSSGSQGGDASSTPYAPSGAPVSTEGYNPEAPALNASTTMPSFIAANFSVPPPPLHMGMPMGSAPFNYVQPMATMSGPMRGTFRGRGRRGRFGPYSSERVQPNKSTTIEVRRIPPEINKLGTVNQHFSQFGDITNIQISFDGSPDTALVTFAKLPDAQAAMKSQKPILDNRFIQISWHKPPPPPVAEAPASEKANGLAAILPVIPIATTPAASETQAIALRARQEAENKQKELRDKRNRIANKKRERVEKNKSFLQMKSNAYHKLANEYKLILEKAKNAAAAEKPKLVSLVKQTDTIMASLSAEIRELHELVRKDEEEMTKGIFEESPEKSPSPSAAEDKPEKEEVKEQEPLNVKEDEEENVEGDTSITA